MSDILKRTARIINKQHAPIHRESIEGNRNTQQIGQTRFRVTRWLLSNIWQGNLGVLFTVAPKGSQAINNHCRVTWSGVIRCWGSVYAARAGREADGCGKRGNLTHTLSLFLPNHRHTTDSFNPLQTSATDPPNVPTGISKKWTLTVTGDVE